MKGTPGMVFFAILKLFALTAQPIQNGAGEVQSCTKDLCIGSAPN